MSDQGTVRLCSADFTYGLHDMLSFHNPNDTALDVLRIDAGPHIGRFNVGMAGSSFR